MNWFRWYHGTATDPKLAYVAHISQQPLPLVIAVWVMLLETASQSNPRGSIASFDTDCAAVTLVTVTLHIEQIMAAMAQKEMVIDGRIGKWGMRQCDPTAAERMRNYRERLKLQNDTVTPVTVTLRSVTDVTPEEKRRDKQYIDHFPDSAAIFEKCWAEYPNKIGKEAAARHFKAQIKTVEEARRLFDSIQNYASKVADTDKQYIKHGSAFFNGLWKDYANAE